MEKLDCKCLDFLEQTLAELWTLKEIPVRAQKEVRSMVEKSSIVLETTYILS